MRNQCTSCGQLLADEDIFCGTCGAKVESATAIANYPITTTTNTSAIGGLLGSLIVGATSVSLLVSSDHPIHLLVIYSIFILGALIGVLVFVGALRTKMYLVPCPSCKTQIQFPVNENAVTCEPCQKRLIIVDGKIKVVQ
jgi:uncharacterized membrane protein YvbJ